MVRVMVMYHGKVMVLQGLEMGRGLVVGIVEGRGWVREAEVERVLLRVAGRVWEEG
jgi:hypothetical protein